MVYYFFFPVKMLKIYNTSYLHQDRYIKICNELCSKSAPVL